jgi:ABC-2 type transport system ATP-binding protein
MTAGVLALETRGLTKHFDKIVAVDGVDLQVRMGEVFGFLGPNGSGKSTTIAMVLGLVHPTSGAALVFGQPVERRDPALFRRVGAVVENVPFYPYLSGRDNLIAMAMTSGGVPPKRVDEVLRTVGLGERAESKAGTYSLGMKQRLAIAAALLTDPDLLILDEPTNGLDPAGMMEVRQLIRDVAARGKAVFLSSHLLHEVQQVCTRVAVLRRGRVLREGTIDELLATGEARVRVRVPDPQAAMPIVRGLDFVKDASVKDGWLEVQAPPDSSARINVALVQGGAAPSELRVDRESLEDFFREVTRSDEAEAEAQAQHAQKPEKGKK